MTALANYLENIVMLNRLPPPPDIVILSEAKDLRVAGTDNKTPWSPQNEIVILSEVPAPKDEIVILSEAKDLRVASTNSRTTWSPKNNIVILSEVPAPKDEIVILSEAKDLRVAGTDNRTTSSPQNEIVILSEVPAPLRGRSRRTCMSLPRHKILLGLSLLILLFLPTLHAQKPKTTNKVTGTATYALTKDFLAAAPKRFNGSPGHAAAENFIRAQFTPEEKDHRFEVDNFTASTPAGLQSMHNFIVKYPGKKDGVIVLASHYETNYPLRDTAFVGANDGACTSALLIEIGHYLRTHPPQGYSIWLLFDDGEEAVKEWSDADSLYGTRHLAAKWSQDGTLGHIKAVLVADMIGDKDLNIDRDDSSDRHLLDLLKQAAANTHHADHLFKNHTPILDDTVPFAKRGVPVLDIIDIDYGPKTRATPDGYHHTPEDTIDKISAASLQIAADLFMETIRLIDQH